MTEARVRTDRGWSPVTCNAISVPGRLQNCAEMARRHSLKVWVASFFTATTKARPSTAHSYSRARESACTVLLETTPTSGWWLALETGAFLHCKQCRAF